MYNRVLVPMATLGQVENPQTQKYFARATYVHKLVERELIPVFVNDTMPFSMIDELYKQCAGCLFMGGGDFDAKYFREENHPKNDCAEPDRDKLELFLLQKILSDKKPYLGICRGCQALAIAGGGSLFQHIPDIVHHENHGIGEGKTYDHLYTNEKHPINIAESTKTSKLLKKNEIFVNSGHHQAVKSLGSHFTVAATCTDGVVEIIEHTDPDYFCFGVQFHPEAMNGDTDVFFDEFANAVEKYAENNIIN